MPEYSPYASPNATIGRLKYWGLSTKKILGQHFLVDDGVVGRILRLAELEPGDEVFEIGPGIGTLTLAMLNVGARVFSVEKDMDMIDPLCDIADCYPKRFDWLRMDALDYIREFPMPEDFKLVANLPYAVAATLVLDYFQLAPGMRSATVMVQKEVARRMAASPNNKDYGAYSVKLQLLARPGNSFTVAPSCFLPRPRVDSTVIRLDRLAQSADAELLRCASFLADAAFANRRKTIRNSMQGHFVERGKDPLLVDALLAAVNIPANIRGETLSPSQYLELGQAYQQLRPRRDRAGHRRAENLPT